MYFSYFLFYMMEPLLKISSSTQSQHFCWCVVLAVPNVFINLEWILAQNAMLNNDLSFMQISHIDLCMTS